MRVAVGTDHGGFPVYQMAIDEVARVGHEAIGVNPSGKVQPDDDYPDYAELVAKALQQQDCERGILICGSGVGVAVAANKIPGIRAGLCHDTYSAHQGVEHDDANVLVLGSRIIGPELAKDLVRAFLAARYSGEERHRRRVAKIAALELKY